MQSIGEILMNSLSASSAGKRFTEAMRAAMNATPEERRMAAQRKIDRYNAETGSLNLTDGYDCPICKNRGNTAYLRESNGAFYETYPPCKCMAIRQSIRRMQQSGLENSIKQCTFEKFKTDTPWRKDMLESAKRYLDAGDGAQAGAWFVVCGAVGSGKTHICTAIARKLLYAMPLHYMTWPGDATKIKALVGDDEEYAREVGRLKNVKALYIDDFFKPVREYDAIHDKYIVKPPTTADVRLAYEIINHRYINHMVTIISSERYLSELMDIDEATASRIAQCSRGYCITLKREREKNYRLTDEVML